MSHTNGVPFPAMSEANSRDVTADKAFGQRVRDARTARGWSQSRLAEHLELDTSGVSRIEAGKTRLSLSQAVRIASVLGMSLDTLSEAATPEGELDAALAALDSAVLAARDALTAALTAAVRVDAAGRNVTPDALRAAVGETDPEDTLGGLVARVARTAAGSGSAVVVDDETADKMAPLVWAIAERISAAG